MQLTSKFFREPLVLFSLVAAAVFGFYALTTPEQNETIGFSSEHIADAIGNREMLVGRSLTPEEEATLINVLVNQEILVREAIARGFHLHDSKTRARLVTQMHFVMSENAPEPTDQDLIELQKQDSSRYMLPESVTFDHVFFEKDEDAAFALMAQINAGEDIPPDAGDRFWLGNRMEFYSASQLLTVLGANFSQRLKSLTPGVWAGPIRSGRGWHIVRLEQFHPPEPFPKEELDRLLREDWKTAFRQTTFDARLAEMRSNYRISLPDSDLADQVKTKDLGEN